MSVAVQQRPILNDLPGLAVRGMISATLGLRHSGSRRVEIRYELAGPPEAPILLVAGGISAGRHVLSSPDLAESGWWEMQRPALSRCRTLAIDWIGADGALDCPIDPSDQAVAIGLVLDDLGIGRIAGFVGASYGAMVGLHFVAQEPGRCGRVLAISASDRAHPFSSACRSLQRKAVALGERGGDPAAGVALARALAMLTYRTADEYRERFDAPPTVSAADVRVSAEEYLDAQGARYAARTSPVAYRRLSESIDLHQVDPARIAIPATFVAVESDWLVPIDDIRSLAATIPGAKFILMPSLFGHDGFLKEVAQMDVILTDFIASLERGR